MHRIHITGASGSGVSTLGRALAARLGAPQYDTDDFYWLPTDPPFAEKRPVTERLALLEPLLAGESWVLSGSLVGWGDPLMRFSTAAVFVVTPSAVRMERLRRRESQRYGGAIAPGGKMYEISRAFMAWAAQYDDPAFSGRSRATHEKWLAEMPLPVVRVDGTRPTGELVEMVIDGLAKVWEGAR
jgi:adenylate kinase family enzyme